MAPRGMRIFLHDSVDEDFALISNRLRPMKLKKPLAKVNYELDYLHEPRPIPESPTADEKDRALFEKVGTPKEPRLAEEGAPPLQRDVRRDEPHAQGE